MSGEDCDYLFKAVLVGDAAVGKSNLLWRIAGGEFRLDSKPTIGVEFAYRDVKVGGSLVKAQLWDTAGQERFRAITSSYYRGALGALLVYDITRQATFDSATKWLREMRQFGSGEMVIILVGNKSDLQHAREVPAEDGRRLAEQEGLCFMETSALTNSNVEDAFMAMVTRILEATVAQRALDSGPGGGAAPQPDPGRVLLVTDEVSATRKPTCCSG
ncbi:unnamed protein product [Spirodela intermedia]|uniref:Uncharacterized protein n=1 Tax=Spirodela intermedia TaxID=51605 RepID=A0A7I8KX05_SPIIN|nr:unnamed protein product [Spirodela intermedia]